MIVTKPGFLLRTLFLVIFIFLISNAAFAQFEGGNGSESDPWQVSTLEQLQSLADYPDAHFIQIADIDASPTADWNDGLGFEPIGNSNSRFTGSLNGNGYTISGLTIYRTGQNYAGLFGVIQNATLRNIQLISADISAKDYVGGLVGTMNSGIIEKSSVTGIIRGELFIGGLTGRLHQGTIRTSYSEANISGTNSVGGIAGDMEIAEIAHSYSLSDIVGEAQVGGLAGSVHAITGYYSDDTTGMMIGSFAAGLVEGEQETGGLIGYVEWIVLLKSKEYQPDSRLSAIKFADVNSLLTSYWDSVATGQPFAIGSDHLWNGFAVDTVGLDSSQMIGKNAYIFMLDFDFNERWQLTSGYPVLSWQEPDDTVEIPNVPRIIAGSTEINFGVSGIGIQKTIGFTIQNTGNIPLNVNLSISGPDEQFFRIDEADQSSSVSPGDTLFVPVHFTPVISDSVQAELLVEHDAPNKESPLAVALSGNGLEVDFAGGTGTEQDPWQIETLSQLQDIRLILHDHYILMNNIDASETYQWNEGEGFNPIGDVEIGFSGSFNGNDYEINGLFINRLDTNGVGLFGFMDQGTIERVNLREVQITGGRYTGSLVGFKRAGTVTDSHSDGDVQGTGTNTGGFIGYQRSGDLRNISASVNVTGLDQTGGLIGFNGATIFNSWASGSVTGQYEVGGLTGRNGDAPPLAGYISRSYATGDVTGQERVGGLSGSHLNGEIENVFSTGNVSGETTVGGLIGRASERITYSYAIGTVEGESQVGGVAGSTGGISPFSFTYWDVDVSGVSEASGSGSSEGITSSTTHEMRQQSTYEGWDFDEVWAISEGETYPYLQQLGLPVSNELEPHPREIPHSVELHQNYPNPFNPATVIGYQLSENWNVTLEVFDITGRRVAILVDELQAAGQHQVTFDASSLSSGVYLYRLSTGEGIRTRKMILVK